MSGRQRSESLAGLGTILSCHTPKQDRRQRRARWKVETGQGPRRAVRPKAKAERKPAHACVAVARRRRAAIGGRTCARRRSINDLALGDAGLARNHFPMEGFWPALLADPIVCRSTVYALHRCADTSARRSTMDTAQLGTIPQVSDFSAGMATRLRVDVDQLPSTKSALAVLRGAHPPGYPRLPRNEAIPFFQFHLVSGVRRSCVHECHGNQTSLLGK